ncbi:MAG: hypothetical protein HWD58_13165 [Bacteroidota bacterium]|nr:MAG: hypothetical protein HWD58_13165 [Bacteroidota bacterium]
MADNGTQFSGQRLGTYTGTLQECGPSGCTSSDTSFELVLESSAYYFQMGKIKRPVEFSPNYSNFQSIDVVYLDSAHTTSMRIISGYFKNDSVTVTFHSQLGFEPTNSLFAVKK